MSEERLITAKEVAAMYGVTEPTVWRWADTDRIPRPRRLSAKCTRWLLSEITDHIRNIQRAEKAEAAA